jgi:hypothetical protein
MSGHHDPCQELKDELDGIDAALFLARQQLRTASPSEKPEILARIRSLLLDEQVTGLAFNECRQRNPILSSISCNPIKAVIPVGAVQQFTAVGQFVGGSPKDLTASVTWASLDPGIATVSNDLGMRTQGQATGVRLGTTPIRAADASGSIVGEATLSVGLVAIVVNPSEATVSSLGGRSSQQFTAIGTFEDGTDRDVTDSVLWSSSDPIVATVSNAVGSPGNAEGKRTGETFIYAFTTTIGTPGVGGRAKLTVT